MRRTVATIKTGTLFVSCGRWRRSTHSGQAAIDRRERLLDVIRVVVKMRGESQDVPARRHDDPGLVETPGQDPHVGAGEPGCDDRGARAVVRGRQDFGISFMQSL